MLWELSTRIVHPYYTSKVGHGCSSAGITPIRAVTPIDR